MKKILSVIFLASTFLSTSHLWGMDEMQEGSLVPFQGGKGIVTIGQNQYTQQRCVDIVKSHASYELLTEFQKTIPQSFVILNTSKNVSETGYNSKIKPYSYDRTEITMNFLFVNDADLFLSGQRNFPKTSVSMPIGNDGCLYNYNQGPLVLLKTYEEVAYAAFASQLRNSRGANHNLILESIQAKAFVNGVTQSVYMQLSDIYSFDYSEAAERTSQIFSLGINEDKKLVLAPMPF